MKDYVERMIEEGADLEVKIENARNALETMKLNDTQKSLLQEQIEAMRTYLDCLNRRLEFEKVD